jgi:Hypoxia induced protein conserved region
MFTPASLRDASVGFATAQAELHSQVMADFLSHIAVPIAIGAVAVVLLLGLINMMRGGSGNTSQKLMRLRVLLQFIAIVVIMFTLWVMAK